MRLPVRCLEIKTPERLYYEMDLVGADPAGILGMAAGQLHYNLKLQGLSPPQANMIKQDMLSAGGEAVASGGAVSRPVEAAGAILSGTLKHFDILVEKLAAHPPLLGLGDIASGIKNTLENTSRRRVVIKGMGREWALEGRTIIMGILNVTPDSFSDGGEFFDKDRAVERALEMMDEGADWIDVGGESTRPGAPPVGVEEELGRVIPVVKELSRKGMTVSVDTTKARVAREALEAGAGMINDVSALSSDPLMAQVCARYKAPVILMHKRGEPGTMQNDTEYRDITGEVYNYLASRIEHAVSSGIEAESVIIDPGIGFGKSREGNIEIIRNLHEFRSLGRPVLIGASRKSFIAKTLGRDDMPARITGGVAVSAAAILNGAQILRVHDVKETRDASDMIDAIKQGGP